MKTVKFNSISDSIADATDFPNQLLEGSILITVKGNQQILIENYQGLISYEADSIQIQSKKELIYIYGHQLLIHYYTKEEMKISGIIEKIELRSSV